MTKWQAGGLALDLIFFPRTKLLKHMHTMIKPLADRVVIEPKEAETQTASGLYIPDTAKEKI